MFSLQTCVRVKKLKPRSVRKPIWKDVLFSRTFHWDLRDSNNLLMDWKMQIYCPFFFSPSFQYLDASEKRQLEGQISSVHSSSRFFVFTLQNFHFVKNWSEIEVLRKGLAILLALSLTRSWKLISQGVEHIENIFSASHHKSVFSFNVE